MPQNDLFNLLMAGALGIGVFCAIAVSFGAVGLIWGLLPEERRDQVALVLEFVFGPDIAPVDALTGVVLGNVVVATALALLGVPAMFIVFAMIAGIATPIVLYMNASIRRARELELALPMALQQVANEMAAGATLETALKKVAGTAPPPADVEMSRLQRRVEVMGVDAAFEDMAKRLDSRSFALTASVVRVGTSSGGKLIEAIKSLSRTLIEIERLNRKIRTASENGRRNLYLMSIIGPLVAIGSTAVVNHETSLLDDGLGQVLVGFAVIAFVAAHFFGWKLTRVKV